MKRTMTLTALGVVCAAPSSFAALHSIQATITSDNHYALFVGNATGTMVQLIGGNELGAGGSPGTYNWSLPESYNFNTSFDTIYIAAWSDDNVAQGLLADFTINGDEVLSGDTTVWDVYATGNDKDDGSAYPTTAEMGTQIGVANANAGGVGTSTGWSPIAVGGANGVSPWGSVGGISSAANWMWWTNGSANAFEPGYDWNEYLIFRTKVAAIPAPAASLLGVLGLGLVGMFRRRLAA